jgi:hypothetical protein
LLIPKNGCKVCPVSSYKSIETHKRDRGGQNETCNNSRPVQGHLQSGDIDIIVDWIHIRHQVTDREKWRYFVH